MFSFYLVVWKRKCVFKDSKMPWIPYQGKQDVSLDDFSGSEAEDRLKSRLQNNMESPPVAEDGNEPGAIVDNNPPDPSDAPQAANLGRSKSSSFRRRLRKQVVPKRAPFFWMLFETAIWIIMIELNCSNDLAVMARFDICPTPDWLCSLWFAAAGCCRSLWKLVVCVDEYVCVCLRWTYVAAISMGVPAWHSFCGARC